MLQVEYEQLKEQHLRKGINALSSPPDLAVSPQHTSEDAELIAEAKLLRQHKGRLEARMQILEDHNKQLESQLHRLRQLLEQVQTLELFLLGDKSYLWDAVSVFLSKSINPPMPNIHPYASNLIPH